MRIETISEIDRWRAKVFGWWDPNCDTEGVGRTKEEAIAGALDKLKDMQEEIGEFIKEQSALLLRRDGVPE